MRWLRNPQNRVRASWVVFFSSVVAWPVTALTVARHEPQFILGLSWFAIIQSSVLLIATTDVRREQEGENGGS